MEANRTATDLLSTIRATSAQQMGRALAACGATREGRTQVYVFPSGTKVRVYKRGSQSFALANLSEHGELLEGSLVESVLECFRTGNVVTVVA